MISYNNQVIKLLPYNAPVKLYDKNMQYIKPHEVDRAWPAYLMWYGPKMAGLIFLNEKSFITIIITCVNATEMIDRAGTILTIVLVTNVLPLLQSRKHANGYDNAFHLQRRLVLWVCGRLQSFLSVTPHTNQRPHIHTMHTVRIYRQYSALLNLVH